VLRKVSGWIQVTHRIGGPYSRLTRDVALHVAGKNCLAPVQVGHFVAVTLYVWTLQHFLATT
jgi:hypothetical protein